MNDKTISGPFGAYPINSGGGVLNALCGEGVPLNTVERLTICHKVGDYNIVKDGDTEFARYKYFDGIDTPLFMFQNQNYGRHSAVWNENDVLQPKLKLCLHHHGSASLVMSTHRDNDLFTEDLYLFIKGMLGANRSHISEDSSEWEKLNHKQYVLKNNASAFFQGGSEKFDEYLYIEFWKPAGAQAFIDHINETFVYKGRVKPPVHSMEY